MEGTDLAILSAVALATSVLSAIVGMAGGITLLSVMLLFLEPLAAIPLHGVIQLVSNSSRAVIQRRHIDRGIMWRYGVLLIPMGFVGLAIAQELPPSALRALIGIFVLVATWAPGWLMLGSHPERADRNRRFLALGAVAGVANVTLGAVGPLIAPFFLDVGLARQGIIGTKAACQALGHVVKIVIFSIAGFVYSEYAPALALLCAVTVVGTWMGSRMLEWVNELWFRRLYMGVLTIIALRLVLGELSALGCL